jgi:hypothetical protein
MRRTIAEELSATELALLFYVVNGTQCAKDGITVDLVERDGATRLTLYQAGARGVRCASERPARLIA